jgi:hypothetical protein
MGAWETGPWDNDTALDWFDGMMEKTGLAKYVEGTLYQEINSNDPGAADEIRAAVSVLVLLGHLGIWPIDDWKPHMNLAISRLEEILVKNKAPGSEEQIQAEIAILKSRLENRSLGNVKKVKWWHFDEV